MNYSPSSKKQLALLYFPDITPQSAVHKLMSLISDDTHLSDRLRTTGYTRYRKTLTHKQVEMIYEHLGKPANS